MSLPAAVANVQPQPDPDSGVDDFVMQTARTMALQESIKSLMLPSDDEAIADGTFDQHTLYIVRRAITFEQYILNGEIVLPDVSDQTEDADGRPA